MTQDDIEERNFIVGWALILCLAVGGLWLILTMI